MQNENQQSASESSTKSKLEANRKLVFDEFEFSPHKQQLLYKGKPCLLEPKMLQLLTLLIGQRPKVVSKEELIAKLWPDAVVSDWSLARLVSDTRKLIEDDGRQQSIIKTTRGKGFAFAANVDEIIQAYSEKAFSVETPRGGESARPSENKPNQSSRLQKDKISSLTAMKTVWFALGILMTTIAGFTLYNFLYSQQSVHQQQGHYLEIMHEIQKNLRLTKTTFLAQKRRRLELKELLTAKSPEKTPLSSERRIRLHYPHLTSEERFIFDQIRALTEGPMYQGNKRILELLEQHPEIYREIDTFHALYNHLIIWVNKYNKIFLNQPDMCFVFVGEEDGVPFPSKIDGQVNEWVRKNSTAD